MLRKSPQQAAASALAAWLGEQLTDATVIDRWPDPDQEFSADVTISVTLIGEPEDTSFEPEIVGDGTLIAGELYEWTWRVLERKHRLQVDVWTKYDVARDDALLRVEEAVHSGISTIDPTADPVDSGLALDLTCQGWQDQIADYEIGSPSIADTPDAHQRGEFRGMLHGTARMNLTVKARSPRLATAKFRLLLSERGTEPTDGLVASVTDTSETYTKEP